MRCVFILSLMVVALFGCNTNKSSSWDVSAEAKGVSSGSLLTDTLLINWSFLDSVKNIHDLDTVKSSISYSLFYSADGECAACVNVLIDWLRAVKEARTDQRLRNIMVLRAHDEYLIEHYFKQTNTTLEDEDYLLIDRKSTFQSVNKFVSTDIEVFLVDSDGRVVSRGSPFTNKDIHSFYVSRGILKGN
jgi:hypothetical protein